MKNAFSNDVWHVCRELEYTSFYSHRRWRSETEHTEAETNPETINPPVGNVMSKVKELVRSSNFLMKGFFKHA
jgi:hypothetical protein